MGMDDEDGDGLPEWWVNLHGLDKWRKMRYSTLAGTAGDWMQIVASNMEGIEGTNTTGWVGNPYRAAGTTTQPTDAGADWHCRAYRPRLHGLWLNRQLDRLSRKLRVRRRRLGRLIRPACSRKSEHRAPVEAPFTLTLFNGTARMLVNGQNVGLAGSGTVDIAQYLRRCNQIYLYLTDTAARPERRLPSRPATDLQSVLLRC